MDPNQRQAKKVQKDKRRKQYDDLQVQGTNNSSIVSKRSVEMLYTKKLQPELGEWFKHFVKNGKRRSPAINRGYWIRMEAIRQLVLRCSDQNKKVQVVNLGCGFDPLPFQLMGLHTEMRFLDFDYPELVENKRRMIRESPEIMELLGSVTEYERVEEKEKKKKEKKRQSEKKVKKYEKVDIESKIDGMDDKIYEKTEAYNQLYAEANNQLNEKPTTINQLSENDTKNTSPIPGLRLSSQNYFLVGCDLKNQERFKTQLDLLLDKSYTTIFIAEVSLAYMKPEDANPVIEISLKVPNSHFVILEQVLPDGTSNAFAQKMLYHFAHLRSPLQCVETYPQPEDQVARFKQWFPHVEIANLFENWLQLVDDEMKKRVAEIEDFDEWEEFIVFCQHYVVVHASNMNQFYYKNKEACVQDFAASEIQVKGYASEIELKFAAAAGGSEIIVHGGLHQTREGDTFKIVDGKKKKIEKIDEETLNKTFDEEALKTTSNEKLSTTTSEKLSTTTSNEKLSTTTSNEKPSTKSIDKTNCSPGPRMCHTLTNIGNKYILIGGRTRPQHNLRDIWELKDEKWRKIGDLPIEISRHSACAMGQDVLLFAEGRFFKVNSDSIQELTVDGNIPALRSCSMASNGEIAVITGGIMADHEPSVNSTVYSICVRGARVEVKRLFDEPILARIGAESAFVGDEVLVCGGVCPDQLLTRMTNIVLIGMDGNVQSVEIPEEVYREVMLIGLRMVKVDDDLIVIGGGGVCYSFGTFYSGGLKIVRI